MKTPLSLLLVSLIILSNIARAQEQPQQQSDDVLRVNTELVQTEVLVLDAQERFVDGIGREQFELRVDGKPVPVSFFERVSAGSVKEEQLASARAGAAAAAERESPVRVSNRGRTIIFFIDDFHLSAESLQRARKSMLYFIDKQMGVGDQVMIASATGQIGFLQQFSDNKAVLRAALERLVHKPYVVRDVEGMGMTEYQALRIEQGDADALYYYVNRMEQETRFQVGGGGKGGPSKEQIAKIIKERAKFMLKQSANVTASTLKSLENLVQATTPLAGRKVLFFLSDGFYLNDRNSDARGRLENISDAALRAGAVIYSLDTRGLLLPEADASSGRVDPIGQLARANAGEVAASQDPLTALASDTGGRARLNTYSLIPAVERALKDNSNYYLLAWKPADEEQKGGKFRKVEVSIKGRPELTVRLPRGYLAPDVKAAATTSTARNEKTASSSGKTEVLKPADADFREALTAFAPKRAIPTLLSTSYLDTPNNGTLLTASVQVAQSALSYGADGKQPAAVDVAGVVLNDQGKPAASFKTRLNVNPRSTDTAALDAASVIYNYKSPLKPGLYQVRVAARDDRSGRVGSNMQWIEIPDLTSKRLTLSSLLIGGQLIGSAEKKEADAQVQFSVDRRFQRSSHLGFWIFIYNAGRDAQGQPDVTAQVQIFRDSQSIVTTPPRKLSMAGITDLARIPYGGDFALSGLAPGRYVLQITITDRVANASASQRTSFTVE